jgi:hypothetical protein
MREASSDAGSLARCRRELETGVGSMRYHRRIVTMLARFAQIRARLFNRWRAILLAWMRLEAIA